MVPSRNPSSSGLAGPPPVIDGQPELTASGAGDDHVGVHGADDDRYRKTMELAAVGIAHVSPAGRFLEVNPALCQLLGYTEEELLARSVWDVSHPDDVGATDDVRERLHRGQIDSFCKEKRYVHKDGHPIWLQLDIGVRRDPTGRVLYDISVVQDISARRRAETLLLQAQKLEAVGQLAAGVAHEINTPMQYIGDNTHFLKLAVDRLLDIATAAERVVGDDAQDADRDRLVQALERSKLPMLARRAPAAAGDALAGVENVSRIVSAMKRFSHPGTEEPGPVDVNDSLTTTITVCRNEWKYSAELETDLDPDLPPIHGNVGALNQVWLNMIVNAAHAVADRHGESRGRIVITTRAIDGGKAARVTIADDGSGISQEHLSRIFDHFFTTKELGKGTGQGLAISHQVVVHEHGGSIDVESTPGEGTTFTITLPTTKA